MISINSDIVEQLFIKFSGEIDLLIKQSLKEVKDLRDNPLYFSNGGYYSLTQPELEYIDYLISNFEDLVKCDTNQINTYLISFNNIITASQMKSNNKRFRDELLKRMGYKKLRDQFYPFYFDDMKIKACVYCNSQLTVTVRKVNKKKEAKYQIDHVLPKSEYPCFSISFYNLYPVCSSCNGVKNAQKVNFNLYSNNYLDYSQSNFFFSINKLSLIKYKLNGDPDILQIEFNDNSSGLDKIFSIKGIYNTQKDVVEELILKSMIYNTKYREGIKNDLKKLFNDKSPIINRLITGNYTSPSEIHKRPMAKFTKDIAKQLNLL